MTDLLPGFLAGLLLGAAGITFAVEWTNRREIIRARRDVRTFRSAEIARAARKDRAP